MVDVAPPPGRLRALELSIGSISCLDALEWSRQLRDSSVDCIWTSPPFNLADEMRGGGGREAGEFRYADSDEEQRGDGTHKDEDEYQREQVANLKQWHRALKPDGVLFYSHKNRHQGGRMITPYEWLRRTPLEVMGEIVWNRKGTVNVDSRRFLPASERIYILAKRPGVILWNERRLPDVLDVPPNHHQRKKSGHPCPTHPSIVRACLEVLPRVKDRRLVVADPYSGIGTTGKVARELGMDFLLNDISPTYVAMMQQEFESGSWAMPLDMQVDS